MYLDVVKVWNPFNYWIEKLEKNYDSKCLLWLWWTLGLYAIFLSVLLLFPNRDELLEFFLKVSSKKENKTKEGKHACELGLIRTDFRHWAGQSTHIMLPASVLISAVRRQFSAQGFFNNKNTPCLSPDNTAAGITGPFFSHTHPDTKEKEYRDSLLSDNTYQKFWRSQFSQ